MSQRCVFRLVKRRDKHGNVISSKVVTVWHGGKHNMPNRGDTTGRRCYVKATVSQTRRILCQLDVEAKRIRSSGGVTEIVYTQQGSGRRGPFGALQDAGLKVGWDPEALTD